MVKSEVGDRVVGLNYRWLTPILGREQYMELLGSIAKKPF